jgi:undecaprenyl-diphosphatase
LTFAQAMFLAVLQGVSELFPVSSLGHTVLLPPLLGWHLDQSDESFLAFVVVLHLGTALALLVFYRDEWLRIVRALLVSVARGRLSDDRDERIGWLLVIGTIPVGILGVLLQTPVRALFASPIPVAVFLMVNAGVMFAGEALRRRQHAATEREGKPIERVSWREGLFVGLAQSLALLPGISRSGSTIVAGLLADLDHEDAARYAFLLATPVIGAASLLEVPKLFGPGVAIGPVEAFAGCLVAGVTAYASVAFLTRYFRHNDLRPFGWYCLVAGAVALVLFTTKVVG